MPALWTDVIDPAELTGYARASLADYELQRGTLARWLPNRDTQDTVVRFVAGQHGLIPEARYRAYDAEPEIGKGQGGKRVTIELPAISQEVPVGEWQQLQQRRASDDDLRNHIARTVDNVVRAIADRVEKTRGVVLSTGKATINQSNFKIDDDFGRDPALTYTAPALWSVPTTDALSQLVAAQDLYVEKAGADPGTILLSRRALRALSATDGFVTTLGNGASRPATADQVNAIISSAGLPPIITYDRRTASGRVLPDTLVLLLPPEVDPTDWQGTELGATFWGETLTALDADYGIEPAETPGIVAGVYRNETPPLIAEVIGDSINLPVLANANLSLALTVL